MSRLINPPFEFDIKYLMSSRDRFVEEICLIDASERETVEQAFGCIHAIRKQFRRSKISRMGRTYLRYFEKEWLLYTTCRLYTATRNNLAHWDSIDQWHANDGPTNTQLWSLNMLHRVVDEADIDLRYPHGHTQEEEEAAVSALMMYQGFYGINAVSHY